MKVEDVSRVVALSHDSYIAPGRARVRAELCVCQSRTSDEIYPATSTVTTIVTTSTWAKKSARTEQPAPRFRHHRAAEIHTDRCQFGFHQLGDMQQAPLAEPAGEPAAVSR